MWGKQLQREDQNRQAYGDNLNTKEISWEGGNPYSVGEHCGWAHSCALSTWTSTLGATCVPRAPPGQGQGGKGVGSAGSKGECVTISLGIDELY